MNPAVVELLICPHCGGDLRENKGSLICSRGHTANIARQGYVSLLGRDSGTHTADSLEMVEARERFLASGRFDPLVEGLGEAVADAPEGAVVDLGCGPGFYLDRVLERLPGRTAIGVDNSKFAARRAARTVEGAGVIVADVWDELPIREGIAGLMINVFSPRNGEEMNRILAPGGRLVAVTPQAGHLAELVDAFGMVSVDPDKEQRLERSLGGLAEGAESRDLEWTMGLTREQVADVVGMGPSAGRMDEAAMEAALESLDEETAVTAAVTVTTTTRRDDSE